jgi:ketosteroid isomerase-like protein
MIKNIFAILVMLFIPGFSVLAQTARITQVTKATEQLRKAMVDADATALDRLTDAKLNYGHSGGHVDSKTEFMQKLLGGGSDFVSINLTEQTITISKKIAMVRHNLAAITNDNGKPGEVHLKVLLVWQKLKGKWKLIARQAVKIV